MKRGNVAAVSSFNSVAWKSANVKGVAGATQHVPTPSRPRRVRRQGNLKGDLALAPRARLIRQHVVDAVAGEHEADVVLLQRDQLHSGAGSAAGAALSNRRNETVKAGRLLTRAGAEKHKKDWGSGQKRHLQLGLGADEHGGLFVL